MVVVVMKCWEGLRGQVGGRGWGRMGDGCSGLVGNGSSDTNMVRCHVKCCTFYKDNRFAKSTAQRS